jgi:MFS family permease
MLKKYIAFIGIILIIFTCFLDYMIVSNATPSIQNFFNVSLLNLQWLINIYSIVLATMLVFFGRLGDMFGYQKLFYWGSFFLIIGSLGAGLSNQFGWLLFFRGIQSLGIAMIIVLGPSLIQCIFRENVHTPMSIYSLMGGVGLLAGPYLGGILVTYLSWRWVFLVNIPVLIVGLLICLPTLKNLNQELHKATIDFKGSTLLLICLSTLIYALIRQQTIGLDWLTWLNFLVFLIGVPLLIYIEKRELHPTLSFNFFQKPAFVLAILSNLISGAFVCCGMFFSPLFLQKILGFSPAASGTILLMFAVGNIIFSIIIGQLAKKILGQTTIVYTLLLSIITSIAYIGFFALASIWIGMIAFFLTGILLAVNNTVSPVLATQSVGEKNAGAAIGTIFSTFNLISAVMLGITSVMLHVFINGDLTEKHLQFSYSMIFVFLTVYAIILFLVGLSSAKKLRLTSS